VGLIRGGEANFPNFRDPDDPRKIDVTSGWKNRRAAPSANCKMEARVFMVSSFYWPPLTCNCLYWIPEMLQRYWVICFIADILAKQKYLVQFWWHFPGSFARCQGEFVAILKTGVDQTFASRDSWFREIINLNSLWCVKYNEENASSNSLDC